MYCGVLTLFPNEEPMSAFNLKNRDSGTCDSILEERCAREGDWSEIGDVGGCVGLERGASERRVGKSTWSSSKIER